MSVGKALLAAAVLLASTAAAEAGIFKQASQDKAVPDEYMVVLREHAARPRQCRLENLRCGAALLRSPL